MPKTSAEKNRDLWLNRGRTAGITGKEHPRYWDARDHFRACYEEGLAQGKAADWFLCLNDEVPGRPKIRTIPTPDGYLIWSDDCTMHYGLVRAVNPLVWEAHYQGAPHPLLGKTFESARSAAVALVRHACGQAAERERLNQQVKDNHRKERYHDAEEYMSVPAESIPGRHLAGVLALAVISAVAPERIDELQEEIDARLYKARKHLSQRW